MTLAEFRRAALRPDRWSGLVNGALLLLFIRVARLLVHEVRYEWLVGAFLLTLIVVNPLLIANAARRARRTGTRRASTWKPWVDRLTRLLPKRLSTRGYVIYEDAAGDVRAVKSGFRWWPLLLLPLGVLPIVWATQVRFWWLVLMSLIFSSARVVEEVFFSNDWSHPLLFARLLFIGFGFVIMISWIVALFNADDLEGRRLEKIGYTPVDHIHGRSGPHAIALFAAQN